MRSAWRAGCCAVALACPGQALAHAFLDRTVPAVGSVVHPAPREVVLRFTEAVEPAFSQVTVSDAAGQTVSDGPARPGGDAASLAVGLAVLPPGTYQVAWRVVSVDTHRTQGRFGFTVAP